ncbi:acyltransferase [Telluribacter sp. SYSU D00476]|uniref:acyltransferase family protein n=1 Tax=Telluribacter sp. SYSU D00476 TaxID=2811430 RepID=UPI001FF1377B|nr:acyltransferase [Telluribacter sp. SYSU D00476]
MNSKRYFPNLNGIRSVAALMVLFHHIEQAKAALGIPNIYDLSLIKHIGRLGVGLFFVLSGFLITYLLLQEKHKYQDISASKFYLRRVFRIWPIYYLIIALSYFVFPYIPLFEYPGANENVFNYYGERLAFLAVVLPNYAFVVYNLPYWCAQAWSIGVEEQFYYLWPWIIKYPKRRILIFILFICASALVLYLAMQTVSPTQDEQLDMVMTFLGQFRIQTMAVGGVCAYIVFKDDRKFLDILYRRDTQIGAYILTVLLLVSGFHFPAFMEVYSILFAIIILNLASNPGSIININNRFMNYSGKISYGLYLYHVAVMIPILNLLRDYQPIMSGVSYNLVLYTSVVAISILVASVSYEYLEKPLLRYKDERFGR